jgi:hypothetical protein
MQMILRFSFFNLGIILIFNLFFSALFKLKLLIEKTKEQKWQNPQNMQL